MSKIRIVTDSAAHFLDPAVVGRNKIEVLPHLLKFGTQTMRESDLTSAEFFRLMVAQPPTLIAPSVDQFVQLYSSLMRDTKSILSVHVSQTMSAACANARAAAQQLLGRCTIHVLDSMSASLGLGFLVELAAREADTADSLDSLARIVRKQTARVYSMFYTETLEYLQRGGLLSESHTTLGEMLGIKPLVTIEDGQLVATEKVRTRVQAVDKLIEFVAEFDPIVDRLVIVHHSAGAHASPGEPARTLQNRLTSELHWPIVPTVPYSPSLGTFLGPDATGVVIYQDPNGTAVDAFDSGFNA